jgi:hypothetical protein
VRRINAQLRRERLGGEQSPQGGRGVPDVRSHCSAHVGLVGKAKVGGEIGEAGRAGLEAIERPPDAYAVAVVGQGHAELTSEGTAEPVGRDTEQVGEGEQAVRVGVVIEDGLAGGGDDRPVELPWRCPCRLRPFDELGASGCEQSEQLFGQRIVDVTAAGGNEQTTVGQVELGIDEQD